jgi:hypothetical protein
MPRNRREVPGTTCFSVRQERAAVGLAAGLAVRAVAHDCGVTERTVYTWLADVAGFKAHVTRLKDDAVAVATARLSSAAGRAADTLVGLLDSTDEPVKLRAATSLLDMMMKTREHSELAGRLAAMEARLAESGDGRASSCPVPA